MIESIAVYGFMILVFCVMGTNAGINQMRSQRDRFLTSETIIILFTFAFFCGLRNNVGVDYPSYLEDYLHPELSDGHHEWLYASIENAMHQMGVHYVFYFALIAFLQLFFVLYAFKDQKSIYPFLLFTIMTNGTFFMWMNGMRQCLAISMFIFAYKYIKNRSLFKFLLLVAVAFFIHKSAVIIIPLYLAIFSKDIFKNKIIQLLILFFSILISNLPFWDNYMNQIEFVGNALGLTPENRSITERIQLYEDIHYARGARFYASIFIGVICIFYSDKVKKAYGCEFWYNMFFLGLITSILFYDSAILTRPCMYFIYVQFIMISYTIAYTKKHSKGLINNLSFLTLIVTLLLYLLVYIASNYYTLYYFIWQTPAKMAG